MSDGVLLNPYRFGTAAFDPLTAITWAEVHWAEDPGWTNPGNGNPVDTWDDASGNARDLTSTTTLRPTYNSTGLNSRPALTFDGNDRMWTSAFTQGLTYSMVSIFKTDSATFGATNQVAFARDNISGIFAEGYSVPDRLGAIYAGTTTVTAAASNTAAARLLIGVIVSGTSDVLYVDGVESTGSAGDGGGTSLASAVGSFAAGSNASSLTGAIAFAGLYSGDIRSDGAFSSFESWAASTYGITIA